MPAVTPGLSLFWSAYDPLDMASSSIDVLGFQPGYVALADKLLPGFTTVTTSPRYVSMLCAAVQAAENAFPGRDTSAARTRQERLNAVKSYERAWALACALAANTPGVSDKAIRGLRGVLYARRRIERLSARERFIRTSSFNLLANQVRYGGIGAYSVMLETCGLASMRSLTLHLRGSALADAFPAPHGLNVWDEGQNLSLDRLRNWGQECHLGTFTKQERQHLVSALQGGTEPGEDDEVRWTTLRLLASFGGPDRREAVLFPRLIRAIRQGDAKRLKAPPSALQRIEATLTMIEPYERLYQTVQFLFDLLRAAATDAAVASLSEVAGLENCQWAQKAAQEAIAGLLTALEQAQEIHQRTADDIAKVLNQTGVLPFARELYGETTGVGRLAGVLARHRDVQHGKFDQGERKSTWLHCDQASEIIQLSAQRHELPLAERLNHWEEVPWHPYRTAGGWRFIEACQIR